MGTTISLERIDIVRLDAAHAASLGYEPTDLGLYMFQVDGQHQSDHDSLDQAVAEAGTVAGCPVAAVRDYGVPWMRWTLEVDA